MIKWPEPFRKQGQQLCNDGNTTVFFDAYNKDQLKQAVRDVLTIAFANCKALDNDENSADYRNGANWCAERISALIKEIV